MKAGQALGLLAGLGAMNAMSGRPYGGKRFTGLLDMIDGGGAGQSGDKFEGGGLISALGNLFMKPMQAQQRVEEIATRASARNATPNTTAPATYPVSGFDTQTVQDIAAANEDAYLQAAYGIPEVAPDRPITADVLEQPEKIALTLDEYILAIGSQPNDYTRAQFADDFVRQFGLGAGSGSSGAPLMGQETLAKQGYSVSG